MPLAQSRAHPKKRAAVKTDGGRVRRASKSDLDAIDCVEQRAFTGDRFARRNLARLLASGAAETFVIAGGGAITGYVTLLFRKGSGVARIYSIALAPAARGKGFGRRLLESAERAARRRGADRLRLEFRPSNRRARALYERAGFLLLEVKPAYYADGEDAIRMEKKITARNFRINES
ncbi:MAG: GNAT family N-acetyltransferase [Parvularculaceae bacterium]